MSSVKTDLLLSLLLVLEEQINFFYLLFSINFDVKFTNRLELFRLFDALLPAASIVSRRASLYSSSMSEYGSLKVEFPAIKESESLFI